jgi:hypothetical protein
VREGSLVTVCVTNRGIRRVAAYGAGDAAHVASTATLDGRPVGNDATVRFFYDRPRSLLRLAPEMVDRATLFNAAPAWMLWALLACIAIAVPGLLTYALARAAAKPSPPEPPEA